MSIQAIAWVLSHSQAKGGARLALLSIASHASPDGDSCWPGVPTIAREARLSERQVKNILLQLERSGELQIKRGTGRGHKHQFILVRYQQSLGRFHSSESEDVELKTGKDEISEVNGEIRDHKGCNPQHRNKEDEPSLEPSKEPSAEDAAHPQRSTVTQHPPGCNCAYCSPEGFQNHYQRRELSRTQKAHSRFKSQRASSSGSSQGMGAAAARQHRNHAAVTEVFGASRIGACLEQAAEALKTDITEPTLRMWQRILAPYQPEHIAHAFDTFMATGLFFPKPGEITRLIKHKIAEAAPSALERLRAQKRGEQ